MITNIIVPSMGESITKATIAKWYKHPKDIVKINDILLELETEKVTLEVNATSNGYLQEIFYLEGQEVEVGAIIGSINEQIIESRPLVLKEIIEPIALIQEVKEFKTLSPIEQNIVIKKLEDVPTKDEIFTANDVIPYVSNITHYETTGPRETRQKMSKLRQTIAQRLKDSQNTAAILTTFNEVDMFEIIQIRAKYKDDFAKKFNTKLGFMSFFVKACVSALQDLPNINAQIEGDEIIYKHYYDIGVAVGTENGLVVPVLRDADKLNFAQVETAIAELGARAKANKLTISDLTGGTFSISNGGIYGSMLSTPIINPPQSAILGMHKIQEKPVVIEGQIVIRPMMYLALSYDHRIIDGKDAVTFLVKIKNIIEQPEILLLGI